MFLGLDLGTTNVKALLANEDGRVLARASEPVRLLYLDEGGIEQDIEDNIPTDAATLGAAIKFLKDNSVTADPADADDLGALREKLAKQAKERRERGSNVVALATSDLQQMEA